MKPPVLHPVILGHCVNAIRDIMKNQNFDFDQAFNIFKKDEYTKSRTLSKLTEEEFEDYREEIKKLEGGYKVDVEENEVIQDLEELH